MSLGAFQRLADSLDRIRSRAVDRLRLLHVFPLLPLRFFGLVAGDLVDASSEKPRFSYPLKPSALR